MLKIAEKAKISPVDALFREWRDELTPFTMPTCATNYFDFSTISASHIEKEFSTVTNFY